jgi:hypothetical protein
MPPILERRDYRWPPQACLVDRSDVRVWEPGRSRARHHTIASRQPWVDANPHVEERMRPSAGEDVKLEVLFENLADQWELDTAFESVVTRQAMHPAYQRIIGLGRPAVPLILRRLQREPRQWFWALTAITGEDPAAGNSSPAAAAEAWLRWGWSRGLLGDR